jgi:hypothetical protein
MVRDFPWPQVNCRCRDTRLRRAGLERAFPGASHSHLGGQRQRVELSDVETESQGSQLDLLAPDHS